MLLKIKINHHLFFLCFATTLWTYFLLGGLSSDYYQTWSFVKALFIIDIIPGIALFPVGYYVHKMMTGYDFLAVSFWVAFYASVPLLVYDYLFIGIHLNKGSYNHLRALLY